MSKPIDRDRLKPGDQSKREEESTFSGLTDVDPTRLRTPDGGVSRVDTLPEDFAKLLGRNATAVGHVIGIRYKLLERLGGGAMGEVFVAENLAIGLRVAVKLLKPDLLADAHFRQRFQREAQAIAAIEHPNVARFLDLVVGDPTFLVMEYVRGSTLSSRLRELKRFPTERAVALGIRLCWALRAAHAVGVIHRDLKPANVILTADVEHGEIPKLIDFGLAKLAARGDESSLTRTGQLIGTPQYMSPEQISGKNVDPRSDIYALGCLVYEMITGRPPFTGDDDFQVLYKQVHEPHEPLRKLIPEAPPALEGVLACALAKDPEQRYSTMADMAAALEAAMSDLDRALTRSQASARAVKPHDSLSITTMRPAADSGPLSGRLADLRRKRPTSLRAFLIIAGVVILAGFGGGYAASRIGRKSGTSATRGALFILSEPPGALVELDGKALPQTTPTLATELAPGPHAVKIQRVDAAPITQNVTVRAGERTSVQVTLPPVTHRIDVRSVPDGASVYLDGRLVLGETPTSVEVTDDDFHELRIEKNGYETLTKPITPDDKAPSLQLALQPEKQPRGTLMVDANSAAEVWIDGVNPGYTTPTLGIEVAVGEHLIEVRDGAGNRSQSARATIAQGQTLRLLLGAAGQAANAPIAPVKP
jgi:serine/threonine protein kinase